MRAASRSTSWADTHPRPNGTVVALMEELLLSWYTRNGRDLPWRRTRDPYAILVSEIMLQQTQVDRVIPRYLEWLERWPTAEALAEAPAADVIRAWQGLGYNRRALALHRAAQAIASDGWPDDLTRLPGVGPYTAAAIRNFAFGDDVLPHDVNVDRVERRTGYSFTGAAAQALMDLGATICLARDPALRRVPTRGRLPVPRNTRRAARASRAGSRARSASGARRRCGSSLRRRLRRRATSSTARRWSRSSATASWCCSRTAASACRSCPARRFRR